MVASWSGERGEVGARKGEGGVRGRGEREARGEGWAAVVARRPGPATWKDATGERASQSNEEI